MSAPLPNTSEEVDAACRAVSDAVDAGAAGADALGAVHRAIDAHGLALIDANLEAKVYCQSGCSACCHQWIHDVSSVEVEAVAQAVESAGRAEEVVDTLEFSVAAYEALALTQGHNPKDPQQQEALALDYWAMDRPCPLLDQDGRCTVYAVRPTTCRTYFSLAPPQTCHPEAIRGGRGRGLMVTVPGDAGEQLRTWTEHHGGEGDFFPALLARLQG